MMWRTELIESLKMMGIPAKLAADVPELPASSRGVLVYGSRARGDAVEDSDLDMIVLVAESAPSVTCGDVSVSFYTPAQLDSGVGTLFGAHLARDARVLWDPGEELASQLARMGDVDTKRLFARAKRMSAVLGSMEADLPAYLPGLLREARYLLRSCLYADAIAAGAPCFSVREIAARRGDPDLVELLASRQKSPPSRDALEECITRLQQTIGELPRNPHGSLEALIVNEWENRGDLLSMGFMALGSTGGDSDYAEVEKILL